MNAVTRHTRSVSSGREAGSILQVVTAIGADLVTKIVQRAMAGPTPARR